MPSPVTIGHDVYGLVATVAPTGEVRVSLPYHTRLVETFDSGAWDTINKWVLSNGGGGVLPSAAVGSGTLNGGVAANGFSKVTTLNTPGGGPNFKLTEPGFDFFFDRIQLSVPLSTSGYQFFGSGTSIAAPTIANPITQGMGWEVTTGGVLVPVVYQTGTRVPAIIRPVGDATGLPTLTPAFATSVASFLDGSFRKFFRYFRGDTGYWAMEDQDNVVAYFKRGAGGPDINALPLLYEVISNGAPATVMNIAGLSASASSGTSAALLLNNGAGGYDEYRSNMDANAALITLAAQGAGTVNSPDQLNINGRGVVVGINTTVDAAGSYVVNIQGKDIVSGQYYTIASTPAIAAAAFSTLTLYPGIAVTANVAINAVLPRTWRVQAVVTAGPISATIGASIID